MDSWINHFCLIFLININLSRTQQTCTSLNRKLENDPRKICTGFNSTLRLPILNDITELILSHNEITEIDTFSLNAPMLYNLKKLSIDHNKISEIEVGSFKKMISIEYIDLSKNDVGSLNPELFKFNKQLKRIDLSFNQISVLDLSLINHLQNLKEFILTENPIEVCHESTSQILNYLVEEHIETSFLSTCGITTVTSNIPEPEDRKKNDTLIIFVIVSAMMLVLLLLFSFNVVIYKRMVQKKASSSRTRTSSGSKLLSGNRASVNTEIDSEGYLRPRIVKVPQYLDVIGDYRNSNLITLESIENLRAIKPLVHSTSSLTSHHYEEIQDRQCYSDTKRGYALPKIRK